MKVKPQPVYLPHDISIPQVECSNGERFFRPSDEAVETAVQNLIHLHRDEFMDYVLDYEEAQAEEARGERRIEQYERDTEDR